MKKNLAILDEFEFQITITINQYVAITNNNSYLLSFSTATKISVHIKFTKLSL